MGETQPDPKGKLGTEAEAKAILKKALDSWAFGDSREKFESDHPGIKFNDSNYVTGKKLARYEIGMSRTREGSEHGASFQVLVTLTFTTERGAGVTLNGDYDISFLDSPPPGVWYIQGGVPPQ